MCRSHSSQLVRCTNTSSVKCQGRSGVSWLMLRQTVQLAQDSGMFQAPRIYHPDWKGMSVDVQRIHAITAWGIFAMNAYVLCRFVCSQQLTQSGTCPWSCTRTRTWSSLYVDLIQMTPMTVSYGCRTLDRTRSNASKSPRFSVVWRQNWQTWRRSP